MEGLEQARAIVEQYRANEPQILQDDFNNSQLAAYLPEEVAAQLACHHLAVWGQLPG